LQRDRDALLIFQSAFKRGHCEKSTQHEVQAMSKSFKQSIKNSKRGRWILHPVDAVPVWVPARRSR